jgi:hypothetical protein
MTRPGAVAATVVLPAAAILATLLIAASGLFTIIPQGPIQGGVGAARSRGWLELSGFYPAELDGGRSFSWMGSTARIRLPRLDRSAASRFSLQIQPAAVDRPVDLTVAVDGLALPPRRLIPGPQRIDIELPPRPAGRAVITLAVSETVVPGGTDTRSLGARVEWVALEGVDGRLRVPGESLAAAAVAGLALGAALILTLGAGPLALAVGAGAGGWFGFLLVRDGSFLGAYPDRVQAIAVCAALAAGVCALIARRSGPDPWSPRAAAGAVIVLSACKLALFFHPMVTIGDSIFHVHRAQVVQGGEYFFTSITPRPFFEFPYPPGLYVAVAPLWRAFPAEVQHVWLLRSAAIVAEGLLAAAIYAVVLANWKDRLTAFLACAVSLLVPAGLYTICTSNLTNSFGQSLFGMGMAALLCAHLRGGVVTACVGAALLCAGFLSHFSTFSVGLPLVFVCAIAVFAGGTGAPRRTATALALALVIAATASIGVYYSHFVPVYRKTAQRILAREGQGSERSMAAPAATKARRVSRTIWGEFGAAIMLGAVAGAALRLRARARDPLTLALAGWGAVVIAFWLLAIVTAVEMRASLAAQPLAAILVAVAIASGMRDGRWARIAAATAVASIVLHAVSDWCMCVGVENFWRV